jgi:hypothetical protein
VDGARVGHYCGLAFALHTRGVWLATAMSYAAAGLGVDAWMDGAGHT